MHGLSIVYYSVGRVRTWWRGRRPQAGGAKNWVRHLEILVSGLEILVFWGPTTFFLEIEQGRAILVSWFLGGDGPTHKHNFPPGNTLRSRALSDGCAHNMGVVAEVTARVL